MSDKNIVAFPGCVTPGEANKDIVEILEHMLEDAKAGKLVAFISGGLMADGTMNAAWAVGEQSLSSMVGVLEYTKLSFMRDT